jgi:hypothetical protein
MAIHDQRSGPVLGLHIRQERKVFAMVEARVFVEIFSSLVEKMLR